MSIFIQELNIYIRKNMNINFSVMSYGVNIYVKLK